MANCINCAAPLPKDSTVCIYCNTKNDINLTGIYKFQVETPESQRICPRCSIPMPTIDLKVEGHFYIERCDNCFGLFFDPGELEALIDKSVRNVYHIDFKYLDSLNKIRRSDEYPVTYIKCPVCRKLMNRINYGSQSGVIIDVCKNDGVWLDGGELRQLLEWEKAGGRLLHEKKKAEMDEIKRREEERKILELMKLNELDNPTAYRQYKEMRDKKGYSSIGFSLDSTDIFDGVDVIRVVGKVIGKIFKI